MLKWEEVKELVYEHIRQHTINYPASITIENVEWIQDQYQACLLKGYDCWIKYKDLPIEESRRRVQQTLAISFDVQF